ncbi:MAG: bifunctional lysine ketoglutarate reductase /saccharopine dehydrogenase family protein [Candidatus Bipolaricaulota bacterium]|nr:bifunctional lysine ketoglutarate reductase /saccharopine dehydrogenase family protein [Candidatus Bipolaricaulota bacterium]
MVNRIGIRREDLYAWERRAPLIPEHVRELIAEHKLECVVQSSDRRVYQDDEYRRVGVNVVEDLDGCAVIVGLKEIPVDVLRPEKVYVFFSHTIKGQPFNMPMLQRILQLGSTIIDYEKIVDDRGRRLIFFGNYAGLAGMIDTLWALGQRLAWEGIETPFSDVQQASSYTSLDEAKAEIRAVGEEIRTTGLPATILPLVIGVAGYGNVSRGAQEILDLLPVREATPKELLEGLRDDGRAPIVKVVFKEADTVRPLIAGHPFDLDEYYKHPERYGPCFEQYMPHLHVMVNCIYWEPKYPRLITRQALRELYHEAQPKLRVIGDITCDVKGSIEATVKATEPDEPIYVFQPETGTTSAGVEGHGPVVMAVEILPSELPREASAYFSTILKRFVPTIAQADYSCDFEGLDLPPELKRAIIVYRGALTPAYQYLEQHLNSA